MSLMIREKVIEVIFWLVFIPSLSTLAKEFMTATHIKALQMN